MTGGVRGSAPSAGEGRFELAAAVARMLAAPAGAFDGLPTLLGAMAGAMQGRYAGLWTPGEAARGGGLRLAASFPPTAEGGLGAFVARSREVTLGTGVDLPGRAAEAAGVVEVDDLGAPSSGPRCAEAREAGLRGALAFPAPAGGAVLGVVEIAGLGAPASPEVRAALEVVGSLLGQALGRRRAEAERDERRRVEDALRKGEEHFRFLVENTADLITIIGSDGAVRYQSPLNERLLGYPSGALVGRDAFSLVHPDDLDAVRRSFAQAVANPGQAQALEVRIRRQGGAWLAFEIIARCVPDETGEAIVIATGRDITRRRAREDALRAREEEMREAQKMEAVGRLAGGIAHDFNNVLSIITLATDLALRRLEPGHPVRREMESVRAAAERAHWLTGQLLAYSRRQVMRPVVLDVDTVVAEHGDMLRRLIGEDVALAFRLDAHARVRVDRGQLEQVVMNLVLNARDALPGGGHIRVSTGCEVIDADRAGRVGVPPGRYVALAVADDGHGMDEDTRGRIFEPFFTTKVAGRGAGLGLATVWGIVKQSGGFIEVDSAVGRGSTFTVVLPEVEAPLEHAPRTRLATPIGRGETVLVVEDEEPVRVLVRRVLEDEGYNILEADGADQAIAVATGAGGRIDLLLTDIVMPGLSGRELAEVLRARFPALRVLYMTGYTDDAVVRAGVMTAGAELISKPFTIEALALRVRRVMDRR